MITDLRFAKIGTILMVLTLFSTGVWAGPLLLTNNRVEAGAAKAGIARQTGEVTIRRDLWGVPHIFAATLPEGAYGLGYAQAEDRLEQIFANYRQAIGRMAELKGASWVEEDWKQRLAGHEMICRQRYPELPGEVRALCESFQDGVRAFLAEHPEKISLGAEPIEPWMIPAVSRMLIFNWPMGQAMSKLGRHNQVHFFSNEWAVLPERTADGAALLLIDPHVHWDGAFRFYEFRMHAGGQDISGFAPAGTPFIAVGHNACLGWACTTGGPDTTDVYVEQVDSANPKRYRYADGWREFSNETVTMAVKDAPPIVRTLERSHHGPIALREGNKAFAIACPYLDQIDLITQFYRMMTARNLAEFDTAMAMCQLMPQNIMYADIEGNIQYIRTGRVPIRPAEFDFSKPVPGNTSKSEWLGIHSMSNLVQVLNPSTGYLQNCNISPDMMARGLRLDPSAYLPYIFNTGRGAMGSRARRAVELLETHPKLTIADAIAIALDTHADGCERWQTALRDAAKAVTRSSSEAAALRKAVAILLAWNGMMDQESTGATLYRGWRQFARERNVDENSSPAALVGALAEAVAWLVKNYESYEIPYGQLHRFQRGDHSWPVSGGESGGGQTLRAINSKLEGKVFYGWDGQNWTQLVQFRRGAVRSWSATPYGQSDDPASPHYTDQAEKIFSPGYLKPTWFQPTELEGNIEATKVLRCIQDEKDHWTARAQDNADSNGMRGRMK